ncbi:MAG TPA: choice-of-anchor D domain-containing protein, partial [Acidobacteriaceae bacterium]|nr:choice-of-anchor D domain-containing protein [Acidobacteriaceae bacterium]
MGSKATLQLTLTSSGTAPVTISSSTIAGQAFGISSVAYPAGITGWPATLNPGQQVVLSIAFAPDSATSFTGDLAVASNASGGAVNVPLSGTGDAVPAPNLTLSATSIDFGQSAIGTKVSRTLTLTSTGNAPLNVNTITVSGAMFSVGTVSLPATLQPGQQLSVTVTFDPTTAGTDAGTLTVTSDDPSGPATVSLGGTGTTTTTPQLTVSPTAVNFGNVPLNVPSTQPVTLTSTGSAPVTINAATVTGPGFSVSGANFPLTLNPNQAVTLQVQFDPTTAGAAFGQMTVTSNSTTGATTQVTLSGTGAVAAVSQLTVSAGSLSFGNVTVNSSATLPVTLTSSGTAPLTITAATVGGADFTDSGATFPVTLNPNASVTLQVRFVPTTTGAATGQLSIASNSAGGSPTQVTLSGTGTAAATAQLQVSATSLPFGSVPVNSTATLTLRLISSGTAPVTVNSVALTGTGFSDSGATFPVTLNPNQSVTLNVQFDPTVAGAATGQLTITSTSTTGSTTQVALTGTGTAVTYSISLNWDAPSGSTDPVAGYNVYRSTDGGASFTKLNTSPDTQADYSDTTVQSGASYIYQVTSVDASGVESAPSNQFPLSVP